MSRYSNTHTVSIAAASASTALALEVNQMAAGTWRRATTLESGVAVALRDTTGTSVQHMLTYHIGGAWNPVAKRVHIMGNGHGGASMRHSWYDETTNTWSFVDSAFGASHGYDHYACNPTTGDLYSVRYGGLDFWRRNSSGWTQLANRPERSYVNITWGSAWWSGALTGLSGNQGAFMFASGNDPGEVSWYDPVNNNWSNYTTGWNPSGSSNQYEGAAAYSSQQNVGLFSGWAAAPQNVWRVNSNKTVTLLNTQNNFRVGAQAGGLFCDPQSGDFLALTRNTNGSSGVYSLWMSDPSVSGVDTQQTGSRAPPALIRIDAASGESAGSAFIEIPAHGAMNWGVVMVVTSYDANTGYVHLYRHA
jgi:hypothetical protein